MIPRSSHSAATPGATPDASASEFGLFGGANSVVVPSILRPHAIYLHHKTGRNAGSGRLQLNSPAVSQSRAIWNVADTFDAAAEALVERRIVKEIVRPWRPIVRVRVAIADLALVSRIGIASVQRAAVDLTAASAARTTMKTLAIAAVSSIVRGRPTRWVELWLAHQARDVREWHAGVVIDAPNPAVRTAFFAKTSRIAAFCGRTTFAVATYPCGNASAGSVVANA
jgi:hypothetical protein